MLTSLFSLFCVTGECSGSYTEDQPKTPSHGAARFRSARWGTLTTQVRQSPELLQHRTEGDILVLRINIG